jgi:hypothetical protein
MDSGRAPKPIHYKSRVPGALTERTQVGLHTLQEQSTRGSEIMDSGRAPYTTGAEHPGLWENGLR